MISSRTSCIFFINIKTLKGRLIAYKYRVAVGVVKRVYKKRVATCSCHFVVEVSDGKVAKLLDPSS